MSAIPGIDTGSIINALQELGAVSDDSSEDQYASSHDDSDHHDYEEAQDDPTGAGKLGETRALEFLNTLQPEIVAQHECAQASVQAPPSLHPHVKLFAHQLQATAVILRLKETAYQGLVFADGPMLGKTLPMLMAINIGHRPGDGPSLIVTHESCTFQMMDEIQANFVPGTMPSLRLDDDHAPPGNLSRLKVVVTSYTYVESEFVRLTRFRRQMKNYAHDPNIIRPLQRPTILGGLWSDDGRKIGKDLYLDDAHIIHNSRGRKYAAVKQLRESFTVCVLATTTPLYDDWTSVFALLSMIRGHPFTSMLRMREIFTDANIDGQTEPVWECYPSGHRLDRLVHLLRAFVLLRSEPARPDLNVVRHVMMGNA